MIYTEIAYLYIMRLLIANSAQSDLIECYKPNINGRIDEQKYTLTDLHQSTYEPGH